VVFIRATIYTPNASLRAPRVFAYVEGIAGSLAQDGNVCMPPQLTENKVADVVMNFLEAHPELRPASAASVGYIALQRAFPCEDQAH
jgi:Rap1a immunity proteins